MGVSSRQRIARFRYITLGGVLLAISIAEWVHFLNDHRFWMHFFYWAGASLAVALLIELGYREIVRLHDRLERQLTDSEARIRHQKALVELSSAIVALRDETQICHAAIEALHTKLGYERVSIVLEQSLLDRKLYSSGEIAGEGLNLQNREEGARQGTRIVADEERLLSVERKAENAKPVARVRAPMRAGAVHYGILIVESRRTAPFTTDEMSVIYAVANLAAVALQNAVFFKEQQKRQQESEERQRELTVREQSLSLLNQITREALQARGFLPMLKTITGKICQLFSADTCLTALWDEQQKFPVIQMASGYQAEWIMNPAVDTSVKILASALLNSSRVLTIPEPAITPWINPRLVSRLESQTILVLPLIANEKKLGVVLISYRYKHAFTSVELAFGEQAASQIALAISKEQALDSAQYRAKELGALQKATAALLTTLELDALLGQILDAAMSAIPAAENGALHLVVPETGELQLRAFHGSADPRIHLFRPISVDSYSARAVRFRRPLLIEDALSEPSAATNEDFPSAPPMNSIIVAPLTIEEKVYGAIALGSGKTSAFSQDDLQLLVSFAATATTALQNAQLHAVVQQQAVTDTLTGLYNRRGFFELAEHEILRAQRFNRPLAMILLDIDLFKQINDTHGHLMGDKILAGVSANCKAELRQVDIIARYGGDEFIVLLPETSMKEAISAAERLRTRVEGLSFANNNQLVRVTLCAGVAELQSGDTLKALIERTDQSLYRAKQGGRNRVNAWQ